MVPLTPLDIHNKEFKKSFRGYDEEEVDEFLDQIIDSYETLYKENISLKEALATKDSNISQYKDMEDTLKQTLVIAQQTAEEIRQSSEKQAEVMIKEAELKAANLMKEAQEKARLLLSEAENKVQKVYKDKEELRKQLQLFKMKFKSFLEGQLAMIEEEEYIFQDFQEIGRESNNFFAGGLEAAAGMVEKEPKLLDKELDTADDNKKRNENNVALSEEVTNSLKIKNREVIL